jgi:hypothetical protein
MQSALLRHLKRRAAGPIGSAALAMLAAALAIFAREPYSTAAVASYAGSSSTGPVGSAALVLLEQHWPSRFNSTGLVGSI